MKKLLAVMSILLIGGVNNVHATPIPESNLCDIQFVVVDKNNQTDMRPNIGMVIKGMNGNVIRKVDRRTYRMKWTCRMKLQVAPTVNGVEGYYQNFRVENYTFKVKH